jgi:hypothetical protein
MSADRRLGDHSKIAADRCSKQGRNTKSSNTASWSSAKRILARASEGHLDPENLASLQ